QDRLRRHRQVVRRRLGAEMAAGIRNGCEHQGSGDKEVEGIWLLMSQDTYQLDVVHHGGPHVDRYNKAGTKVGRYRLDKTPLKHKGKIPPTVPVSDYDKFDAAVARRAQQ